MSTGSIWVESDIYELELQSAIDAVRRALVFSTSTTERSRFLEMQLAQLVTTIINQNNQRSPTKRFDGVRWTRWDVQ